jgi:hypothetical protein
VSRKKIWTMRQRKEPENLDEDSGKEGSRPGGPGVHTSGSDPFEPIQYRRQVAARRGDGRHPMLPPAGHAVAATAPAQGEADLKGTSFNVSFQVDSDAHGSAATTGLLQRAVGKDEVGQGFADGRVGTTWGGGRAKTRGGEEAGERVPGIAKFVPRPMLRTAAAQRRPISLQPLQAGVDKPHVNTKTAILVDLYADAAGHITSPSRLKLNQAMLAPADWFEDELRVPQVTSRTAPAE